MKGAVIVVVALMAWSSSVTAVQVEYGVKGGERAGKITRQFNIGCDNALFGDPAPGVKKICKVNGSQVATEGQQMQLSFTSDVEVTYGANAIVTKELLPAHEYACSNQVFGDPAVGVGKACYINGRKEASEGEKFVTPGPVCSKSDIKYGANGTYTTRRICTGRRVNCSNSVFGDPLVGVKKTCYAGTSKLADEGGRFTVAGDANCMCGGRPVTTLNAEGPLNSPGGE